AGARDERSSDVLLERRRVALELVAVELEQLELRRRVLEPDAEVDRRPALVALDRDLRLAALRVDHRDAELPEPVGVERRRAGRDVGGEARRVAVELDARLHRML